MNSITDCPTDIQEPQDKPVVKADPNDVASTVTQNEAQQEEEKKEVVPESK